MQKRPQTKSNFFYNKCPGDTMGTGKIYQHIKGNEQKVLNQHFLKWRKALKHFHQSQEQDMNVHSVHTYSTVLEILARAI